MIEEKVHRKDFGTIGELTVARHLLGQGYSVFSEYGDNSKVDLIALVDNVPIKIQVKSCNSSKGKVSLFLKKNAKGYEYRYNTKDCDIFALYVYYLDRIAFISSKEALEYRSVISFRINEASVNHNQYEPRLFDDYADIKEALRDYTPLTLTNNVEGEEIVQTTTTQ